jgi:hypothetical protein
LWISAKIEKMAVSLLDDTAEKQCEKNSLIAYDHCLLAVSTFLFLKIDVWQIKPQSMI